jgi:single-strand DNA-binding protein
MARRADPERSRLAEESEDSNEVRLVGRLAATPEQRTLPSGDRLATWRIVVRRGGIPPPGKPSVDTFDCAAWSASLRRRVQRWQAGDRIEVSGALRRRFWRTVSGPASRYEVEAGTARRIERAR